MYPRYWVQLTWWPVSICCLAITCSLLIDAKIFLRAKKTQIRHLKLVLPKSGLADILQCTKERYICVLLHVGLVLACKNGRGIQIESEVYNIYIYIYIYIYTYMYIYIYI